MLKLIWLSDTHFVHDGEVLGHDPKRRIKAAVDHINAHHDDASFCVISGDMVDRGSADDYRGLKAHLDELAVPYFPMVGNHDNRILLRETLPVPDDCLDGFVQYRVETAEGLILCLDTQKSGSDAGEFCAARTAWLRSELEAAGDTPVFLFMHHPPHVLHLPMLDVDNMQNGDAFLDLVSEFDCVRYMLLGHVHRPVSGVVRGVPFSTMRSVLYQAPAPRPEWDWSTFQPSEEAPNFGVVMISDGAITIQYDQFCPYAVGGRA